MAYDKWSFAATADGIQVSIPNLADGATTYSQIEGYPMNSLRARLANLTGTSYIQIVQVAENRVLHTDIQFGDVEDPSSISNEQCCEFLNSVFFLADGATQDYFPTFYSARVAVDTCATSNLDILDSVPSTINGVIKDEDEIWNILLFNQTNKQENGLWTGTVGQTDWTRTAAYDTNAELVSVLVYVTAGDTYGGDSFFQFKTLAQMNFDGFIEFCAYDFETIVDEMIRSNKVFTNTVTVQACGEVGFDFSSTSNIIDGHEYTVGDVIDIAMINYPAGDEAFNGVYTATVPLAPDNWSSTVVRKTGYEAFTDFEQLVVSVTNGDTYGGTKWMQTQVDGTIDVDALLFVPALATTLPAQEVEMMKAFVAATPANPTGTTSATGAMMGLGILVNAAVTGRLVINLSGKGSHSGGATPTTIQLRYGTGTPPANGDSDTGTACGNIALISGTGMNFSCAAGINVEIGTEYWIDIICTSNGAQAIFAQNLGMVIHEA